MRVVVTGSDGFVGRRVCALLWERHHDVIECDVDEDVLKFAPESEADVVIHLAANKYATDGEAQPYETSSFNIEATAAALRLAPKVVLASTCKAADPITCYGASKLICERMVLNAGGTVVRLVNVLSSAGSVTEIWAAIPVTEPLPVTNCFRLFIKPMAAARLLVDALELPAGRYGPMLVESIWMRTLARRLYPDRQITPAALRIGDRPQERLLNEYERCVPYDDQFLRICDPWEDADGAASDDRPADAGPSDIERRSTDMAV